MLRLTCRSSLLRLPLLAFPALALCSWSTALLFCRFLSTSTSLHRPTAPAMACCNACIVWSCRDPGSTVVCIGAPVRPHPGLKIGHRTCHPVPTFIDFYRLSYHFLILGSKIVARVSRRFKHTIACRFRRLFPLVQRQAYVSVHHADLRPTGN